jgi:hypothetical protein
MIQKEFPYRLWKLGFDFRRDAEVISNIRLMVLV